MVKCIGRSFLWITTLSCLWRINKICVPECPWRARNIKTIVSWRISTVLEIFLLYPPPPPPAQAYFPLYCQTNEESVGIDSEDFFDSPEMKLLHLLLDALFVNVEEDTSLSSITSSSEKEYFPGFNISPSPPPNRELFLGEGAGKVLFFVVFAFCLWSACKNLSHPVCNAFSSSWTSGIFCLIVVSNSSQTYLIHEKILTQEWVLSLFQRPNSDLNSILYRASKLVCNFLIRAQFWCFPWIQTFLVCDAPFFLLEKVYSRTGHCMKFARDLQCPFVHENIVPISTTLRKSCIHTKFTQFCLVCDSFFNSFLHIAAIERSWLIGSSQSKGTSVLIALSTKWRNSVCSITTGPPR